MLPGIGMHHTFKRTSDAAAHFCGQGNVPHIREKRGITVEIQEFGGQGRILAFTIRSSSQEFTHQQVQWPDSIMETVGHIGDQESQAEQLRGGFREIFVEDARVIVSPFYAPFEFNSLHPSHGIVFNHYFRTIPYLEPSNAGPDGHFQFLSPKNAPFIKVSDPVEHHAPERMPRAVIIRHLKPAVAVRILFRLCNMMTDPENNDSRPRRSLERFDGLFQQPRGYVGIIIETDDVFPVRFPVSHISSCRDSQVPFVPDNLDALSVFARERLQKFRAAVGRGVFHDNQFRASIPVHLTGDTGNGPFQFSNPIMRKHHNRDFRGFHSLSPCYL